jgi:hypothetical protein
LSFRKLSHVLQRHAYLVLSFALGLSSLTVQAKKAWALQQQPEPQQPAPPAPTTGSAAQGAGTNAPVPDVSAAEAANIAIKSVSVFPQAPSASQKTGPAQEFVLEVQATGLDKVDLKNVHLVTFPAQGVTQPQQIFSTGPDNTTLFAPFKAAPDYLVSQVALSTDDSLVAFDVGGEACDFGTKVVLTPQIVPFHQAENKYGNGVAKNFHAIQISIVNQCSTAIIVPLAGLKIVPSILDPKSSEYSPGAAASGVCGNKGDLVPFSLDHVTSIFSTDRKLTGRRAVYFNTVQALATLGSALEPFFAHGFTQAVAILGGGFTTASKEILVDMSSEQLQNLTSQSFGATEQIASDGDLQKFIFVRQNRKCKGSAIETDLSSGKFSVYWQVSPASGVPPKQLRATAAIPGKSKGSEADKSEN